MLARFKPSEILVPLLTMSLMLWFVLELSASRFETSAVILYQAKFFIAEYAAQSFFVGGAIIGVCVGSYWRGKYEQWNRFVESFSVDGKIISIDPRLAVQNRYTHLSLWIALSIVRGLAILVGLYFAAFILFKSLMYFVHFDGGFSRWWLLLPGTLLSMLAAYLMMLPYMMLTKRTGDGLIARLNRNLDYWMRLENAKLAKEESQNLWPDTRTPK